MLVLKILGGVLALALGVWLGLPGRYEQDEEELERLLQRPGGVHRRAKRHFTPLDWYRNETKGSDRRRAETRRFKTAAPKRK
ncbi:MAG: hypothetical protein KY453_01390 [Gemmatimonadetes bacterium]|nr:hypothetical protein [Gemmatimonadota bacterium]